MPFKIVEGTIIAVSNNRYTSTHTDVSSIRISFKNIITICNTTSPISIIGVLPTCGTFVYSIFFGNSNYSVICQVSISNFIDRLPCIRKSYGHCAYLSKWRTIVRHTKSYYIPMVIGNREIYIFHYTIPCIANIKSFSTCSQHISLSGW